MKTLGRMFVLMIALVGIWGTWTVQAQMLFTDVTEEAIKGPMTRSVSMAFGDYDNDGWTDMVIAGAWGVDQSTPRIILFNNEGEGQFTDRTACIPWRPSAHLGGGTIFGDYDNDGDLDLFVPVGAWESSAARSRSMNALLRNDRGVFRDVALEAGLIDALASWNAIWLDYNRDGWLDLYVGNLGSGTPNDPTVRNKLYRNNGDGTFMDVTEEAGLNVQLQPEIGGSNGGMAAGDFNDDGWPDLYMGVMSAPNRLFLNDGHGGFQDATTGAIGDPGDAFGVAVGDIDNDGDLDIFQAVGGTGIVDNSLMLLNNGEGQFSDVTSQVGLSGLLEAHTNSPILADIDNDGDLDLITATPYYLYLNNGDGTFVDQTSRSPMGKGWPMAVGHVDLDGFVDVWIGEEGGDRLYRNMGNANHYLRVQPVGTKSNRNGIGARLIAISGDLTQIREILGGVGYSQDEMVAHFGLGSRTQVDRLEIRWPSGEVDVLRNLPADQTLRVLEGQERAHRVTPTVWKAPPLPDTLVVGATAAWKTTLVLHPAPFEEGAKIARVSADLSELGGPSDLALEEGWENEYRLESTFTVRGPQGLKNLFVRIEQSTSVGSYWTSLGKTVVVLPGEPLGIYEDGMGEGWSVNVKSPAQSDLSSTAFVHSGSFSHAITLLPSGALPGQVTYVFSDPAGMDPFGYSHLEFYINGGASSGQNPTIGGKKLSDRGITVQSDTWTHVSIPLSEVLSETGRLPRIQIGGVVRETFYLDDVKLVAQQTRELPTPVEASEGRTLPSGYALSQNWPNPFNPTTVISYDLPRASEVTLTVYAITGQKVATLVSGHQQASHYEVRWDGRGCANGVYLYRLEAGSFVETRRMLLLK